MICFVTPVFAKGLVSELFRRAVSFGECNIRVIVRYIRHKMLGVVLHIRL